MPFDSSERMKCPPLDVWEPVVEGAVEEREALRLLSHAAECDTCGANLREASAVFSQEISPEEQQQIDALASSQPEWQQRLASDIAHQHPERPRVIGMRRPVLWTAMGALAASVVLVIIWQVRTHNSTDALLAAAYDRERLTDLRIPGGHPVPVHSPERGIGTSQDVPELLQARLQVDRMLEKDPASADAHELLGRILILEKEPESALFELQRAQSRGQKLDRLEFDLGMGYYELGEARQATGNLSDFAQAADHFTRYLESQARADSTALYNRSLCWQKLGDRSRELSDLTAALGAEKDAAWRQVIEKAIQRAKSVPAPSPGGAPSGYLAAPRDDYERALSDYTQRDLSPHAPAIATLAAMGSSHGDAWPADWLSAEHTSHDLRAVNSLKNAIRLNLSGAVADGLREAILARQLFAAEHNRPGSLRAEAEVIYAYRRMGQTQPCLHELASMPDTVAYSWMQADIALERAACVWQDGDFDRAKSEAQSAIDIAERSGLPLLALRAQGFLAGFLTQEGLLEQALSMNAQGLRDSAANPQIPMRRYQFLSDMAIDADRLRLHQVAALLGHDAVNTAVETGNLQISAYAWEVLAQYQLRAGNLIQAESAFQQADAVLQRLGENAATRTYLADWSVDRARLEVLRSRFDQVRQTLQTAEPAVQSTHDLAIQQRYWSQRSELERWMGNSEQAQLSATRAVEQSEHALAKLHNVRQRAAWQLACEEQYESLVEALVMQHRDEEALRAWLLYRSAPERNLTPATLDRSRFDDLPGLSAAAAKTSSITLIYVRLSNAYIAFVVRSGAIRAIPLEASADRIDQLARTYLILCSDPHSNADELHELGVELYRALTPKARLDCEELRLDLPRSLANLPFESLVLPDGTYLGSKVRVVNLAPAWALRRPSPTTLPTKPELLLVDASKAAPGRLSIPAAYDEGAAISASFPAGTVRQVANPADEREILATMRSADAFHFVGHAEHSNGSVRLMLANSGGASSYLDAAALDGLVLKHCRLVFLAACSTSGSAEAIDLRMTLPTSFLRAGAEHVIASRWDADSEAASLLAAHFYQALAKGNSPASAFRDAEESVRVLTRFHHPYYWACFSHMEG